MHYSTESKILQIYLHPGRTRQYDSIVNAAMVKYSLDINKSVQIGELYFDLQNVDMTIKFFKFA